MFSRSEGPPPALDGPLAVNTRLQRGRRLFSGQLKGPESFTADQNGEPGLVFYLFDLRNAVRFHLFTVSLKETSTRAPSMGSCGESATTPSLSSLRWAETSLNVVNRLCNSASCGWMNMYRHLLEKPNGPCVPLPSHIRHAEVIHKGSSVVLSKPWLVKRVLNADVFIRA